MSEKAARKLLRKEDGKASRQRPFENVSLERELTPAAYAAVMTSPWRQDLRRSLTRVLIPSNELLTLTDAAVELEVSGVTNVETARRWFLMAIGRLVQRDERMWTNALQKLLEREETLAMQAAWIATKYAAQWSETDLELIDPILDAAWTVLYDPRDVAFRARLQEATRAAKLAYLPPTTMPSRAPAKPVKPAPAARDAGMAAWLAMPPTRAAAVVPAMPTGRVSPSDAARHVYLAALALSDAAISYAADPKRSEEFAMRAIREAGTAVQLRPTGGWGRDDDSEAVDLAIRDAIFAGLLEMVVPMRPRALAIRSI